METCFLLRLYYIACTLANAVNRFKSFDDTLLFKLIVSTSVLTFTVASMLYIR